MGHQQSRWTAPPFQGSKSNDVVSSATDRSHGVSCPMPWTIRGKGVSADDCPLRATFATKNHQCLAKPGV